MRPIALDEEIEQETLPPIEEESSGPVLPDQDLQEKANRYSFALEGNFSRSGEMYTAIEAGMDDALRQQVAIDESFKEYEENTNLIRAIAGHKEATAEELLVLEDLIFQTANLPPKDAETIIEEKLGQKAIDFGVILNFTPELKKDLDDPSGKGLDVLEIGGGVATKMQFVHDMQVENQAVAENQSWWATGGNILMDVFPGAFTWNMNIAASDTLP